MKAQTRTPPGRLQKLQRLVRYHKKMTEEPLLLAVRFTPARNKGDLFVFEIVENFGSNSVDPEKTIFEVSYASTPGFQMRDGQYLHLVLTNPVEFKVAADQNWKAIVELRKALRAGKTDILFATPQGRSLWSLLS